MSGETLEDLSEDAPSGGFPGGSSSGRLPGRCEAVDAGGRVCGRPCARPETGPGVCCAGHGGEGHPALCEEHARHYDRVWLQDDAETAVLCLQRWLEIARRRDNRFLEARLRANLSEARNWHRRLHEPPDG